MAHKTIAVLICVCALNPVAARERASTLSRVTAPAVGERAGPNPEDTFSRMFPDLPPFAPQTDAVRSAVEQLGRRGGPMDAFDNLTDPIRSITEPGAFSPSNLDHPSLTSGGHMTAGMTFLGQFLDHDITLDLKSLLTQNAAPHRTVNFRSAAFDLDSVYGGGPADSPELYESDGLHLRVEEIAGATAVSRKGRTRYDVPRGTDGAAILGDARNDENVVVSQLHMAMLRFHNAVLDRVAADPRNARKTPPQLFELARQTVRWHYQWIIVHEYLPVTIGAERVAALLRSGPRFFDVEGSRPPRALRNGRRDPRIPVEFSVAAFRFGHSQVRPSYRVNFGGDPAAGGGPLFMFVFDPSVGLTDPDPIDMRGGRRTPRRFVDWQTFFDLGDGNVRPNKLIDTKLSTPLLELPGANGAVTAMPTDGVQSLASRNLMRHVTFGLPSGQAVARRIGVRALSPLQLEDLRPLRLEASTPLWFYVLREAEVLENGERLGPVGARIVGDVFLGLLLADRDSYLATRSGWRPTLPAETPGDFTMADLLRLADVVAPLE